MDEASNSICDPWDLPTTLEYIIANVNEMTTVEAVAAGMLIAKNLNK